MDAGNPAHNDHNPGRAVSAAAVITTTTPVDASISLREAAELQLHEAA